MYRDEVFIQKGLLMFMNADELKIVRDNYDKTEKDKDDFLKTVQSLIDKKDYKREKLELSSK